MRITITLDVMCAASYVAFTRFQRAARHVAAHGGHVEVRFRPFQLAPEASPAGEPVLAALRERFGAGAIEDARRHADRARDEDGLVLVYDRMIATNTFDAHRLIALAARQGRAEVVVERLFRAHFTDGLNVGDPHVLRQLAAETGVTWSDDGAADEVRAALAEVRAAGIRGVPVFEFDGRPPVVGVHSEATYRELLGGAVPTAAAPGSAGDAP